MEHEKRTLSPSLASFQGAIQDDEVQISGYAAVYYRDGDPGTEVRLPIGPDGVYERIQNGAFDKAIAEQDISAIYNHNPDNLLGRKAAGSLTLESDAVGLRYHIRSARTQIAENVATWAKRGELTGSSFAFRVPEGGDDFIKDGAKTVRLLIRVDLEHISPVGGQTPAYGGTSVEAAGALRDVSRAYCRYILATIPTG